MSFTYRIYGLEIESTRKINLLSESLPQSDLDLSVFWESDAAATPDSALLWNKTENSQLSQRIGIEMWQADSENGTFTKFRFQTKDSYFDFLLNPQTNRLWIVHAKEELESDLDSYFVGPILGCVLRLRGVLCLHACVVAINDQAVALAGHKGFGKSTTAAGFACAGFAVLSDDLAVVTPQDNGFVVQSGYPQIRLWTNSVEALFKDTESLPRVYSFMDKRYVTAKEYGEFIDGTLPLTVIYILDRRNDCDLTPFVEKLATQEKFIKLIENAYASYALTSKLRQQEFFKLSALCQSVPIRRLVYGDNLKKLEMQIQTVVKDLRDQNE